MSQGENARLARQEGEALWRFALALYARPGVAEALIRLQDDAGKDVNLVLFCLWLGAVRHRRLDLAGLAAAAAAMRPLAAGAVEPLRGLRRKLKDRPDKDLLDLRRRVMQLEIVAERRVQARLVAAVSLLHAAPQADPLGAASGNLALCLGEDAARPEAGVLHRQLALLTRRA
jgi:uncharacterized protein (TIGR02444 family)